MTDHPQSPDSRQLGGSSNRKRRRLWGAAAAFGVASAVLTAVILIVNPFAETGAIERSTASDRPSDEDSAGGPEASAPAAFNEATCAAYDLASFQELAAPHAAESPEDDVSLDASSTDSYLNCSFSTAIDVRLWIVARELVDAEAAAVSVEDELDFFDGETGHTISDFTEAGDLGFHVVSGDVENASTHTIIFATGRVRVDITVADLNARGLDVESGYAVLGDLARQSADLFAEYD